MRPLIKYCTPKHLELLRQIFELKQKAKKFSRKGAKLAKKGRFSGLKTRISDFLCVLCGLCERRFCFWFYFIGLRSFLVNPF
ncbi:MAG: hypothetical protein A2072_00900 [Nitrospirae bacterium GWC1_57_7]|nr:MAG: hypothetical protein A2072_00900 [Nitrospirae bacterium GWC1_57_7]HAR46678.1 hypothetical protein [Nitrospiraceae bacterium]